MSIEGRKIKMFRCHIDPHIPPRAKNAFMMGDGPEQTRGEAVLTPYGVLAKIQVPDPHQKITVREFIIPWANLENVELLIEEPKAKLKPA